MIRIARHAITRYQERVAPCSYAEARERILAHASALAAAVRFGAPVVRCGDGVRFVIDKGCVVTVLGPGMRSGARMAA